MADLPPEIAMLAGSINQENAVINSMAESMGSVSDPLTGAKLANNSIGAGQPIGIQDLAVDQETGMTLPPPEINSDLPPLSQVLPQNTPPTPQYNKPNIASVSTQPYPSSSTDPLFHPNLQPEILTKLNKIEIILAKLLEVGKVDGNATKKVNS